MIEILEDHGATDSQKDDRNSDRSAAIASLEKIGADARAAIPVLEKATTDENARIRAAATSALAAIGGGHGSSPFSVQKLAPPHDEVRPTQWALSTAYCYSGSSGFSTIPKKTGRRARCSRTMSSPDLPRRLRMAGGGPGPDRDGVGAGHGCRVCGEDRSRQTLAGLLVTRLSSTAIILDKLAAKMLQIGVFLAVGLPIACLLGLLGGIDPRSIVYAYSGTVSRRFSWSLFHCWSRCTLEGRAPRSCWST